MVLIISIIKRCYNNNNIGLHGDHQVCGTASAAPDPVATFLRVSFFCNNLEIYLYIIALTHTHTHVHTHTHTLTHTQPAQSMLYQHIKLYLSGIIALCGLLCFYMGLVLRAVIFSEVMLVHISVVLGAICGCFYTIMVRANIYVKITKLHSYSKHSVLCIYR